MNCEKKISKELKSQDRYIRDILDESQTRGLVRGVRCRVETFI